MKWLAVGLNFYTSLVFSESLTIACASNFLGTLTQLAAAYTKVTGTKINIISGASATLAIQIENDLPVDIFLSADKAHADFLSADVQ